MNEHYDNAMDWAANAFGTAQMLSPQIRSLRAFEEIAEFAQCVGVPQEKLYLVIDTVFSRPRGDPQQELGGVMMTAILLCMACCADPDRVFLDELERVRKMPLEHFTKRNQEKEDLGLK